MMPHDAFMELVAAAVLGIIQGLTEFLPVSSSAHLILVPWLLGWNPEGLTFDVAVHVGTSLSVLVYFWKDWLELGQEFFRGLIQGQPFANGTRRLAWYLMAATLPAMFVGLLFERQIESYLRSPLVPVLTLIAFAGFLHLADRRGSRSRSLEQIGLRDSLWIGAAQALALIPGVSRSGVTISTALLRDVDRTSAARFSFLLSTPIIVGAGLLKGLELLRAGDPAAAGSSAGVLVVGTVTSAVTGFLCIRYFLRYLRTGSFTPFVVYRILLALVVLTLYLRS